MLNNILPFIRQADLESQSIDLLEYLDAIGDLPDLSYPWEAEDHYDGGL